MTTPQITTILFDLDGTLADTAPDLADALNQVLIRHGREELPFATIRPWVSHGGQALIKNGFQFELADPRFEHIRQEFLTIYQNNIAVKTSLFPGMETVLQTLENRGMPWGVVTNKPAWLTDPLMQALRLEQRSACTVSGDTLPERKPHPAPLLHACQLAGGQTEACLYIGDAERDIVAGQRAGMKTLVAMFGYLGENDTPDEWGADGYVEQPEDILTWIDSYNDRLAS